MIEKVPPPEDPDDDRLKIENLTPRPDDAADGCTNCFPGCTTCRTNAPEEDVEAPHEDDAP
jgi:hypothetical protein